MPGSGSELSRSLVLGEKRRLSICALLSSLLLFVVVASVDYTWISMCTQREPALCPSYPHNVPGGSIEFSASYWVLRWISLTVDYGHNWLYAELLIVGLAGIHAYFNLGYVLSLVLPTGSQLGAHMFYIGGSVNNYELVVRPGMGIETLPVVELVVLASLGFALGVAARIGTRSIRNGQVGGWAP